MAGAVRGLVRGLAWLGCWLWLLAPAGAAETVPRVALVIGNNAYHHVRPLSTAVNDARAMAAALREIGFEVLAFEDLDRRGMNRAIAQFADKLAGGVGIVYFAGHGVQLRTGNYLLPVDIEARSERDVEDDAVALDRLLALLTTAGTKLSVVLVDACRDNPLPPSQGRSIGAVRGLSQPVTPNGIMVVYAAGVNEQALDRLGPNDRDPNGLFVRELLPELKRPGLALDDAVKAARERIRQKARAIGHQQNPAIYDQLEGGDFYLVPATTSEPSQPEFDPRQLDIAFWNAIKDSGEAEDFRAYLERFGEQGVFASLARRRLAALSEPKPPAEVTPVRPDGDAARKAGESFRDCAACPEMVVVASGSFLMGSTPAERDWVVSQGGSLDETKDEQPQRRVTISQPLAVGVHEVTRGEFARFVAATGHKAEGGCYTWTGSEYKVDAAASWRAPGFAQTDGHPVVCVSWLDAQAYVKWLSEETGKSYRLLSEAEWEYGARAGKEAMRYWGDDRGNSEACRYANGADRTAKERFPNWTVLSCRDGYVYTAPVGSFGANGWQLRDMLGNVWEWVEDCYQESYEGAPEDGRPWIEEGCPRRVLRGGSWLDYPWFLRSAVRDRSGSEVRLYDACFRVARMLTP